MGLNKEECLKAIDVIARYCADRKGEPVPPRFELTNELDVLMKLIEKHFDNTLDFKHFKLHSKSYLKTLKKDELIDYIYMVYHNWENDNFGFNNVMKYATELLNKNNAYEEIIKKHGLENLTLHELDCAFKKMLSYVEENNRLMNFLSQQNEIIKEYQNGEAYKELKRSYDELLGHAVAFQEELINLKDNPPLKFEELEKGMWVWVKDKKMYKQVIKTYVREFDEIETVHVNGYYLGFEENRFYRYEVKDNAN